MKVACSVFLWSRLFLISSVLLLAGSQVKADEEETWTYSHTVQLNSATGLTAFEGEEDVLPGETRTLRVFAAYEEYEVWVSNLGNVQNVTLWTGAGMGATVSWAVTSGDGTVTALSTATDNDGYGYADFVMGTEACVVTAYVGDGALTTSTSITITPPEPPVETWTYSHSVQSNSGSISCPDGNEGLATGDTRTLQVYVTYEAYDVYVSNLGNTRHENYWSGAGMGASLEWTVVDGDGTLSNISTNSDNDGFGYATFQMGTTNSTVTLTVDVGPGAGQSSMTFTLP